MYPVNPDAQNLGPTETLVLLDSDDELHLTPGTPTVRSEPCYGGPLLTIAFPATAARWLAYAPVGGTPEARWPLSWTASGSCMTP